MYFLVIVVLTFGTLVGGQPPGGALPGEAACMDIVFMFDVSCSVSEADQIKAIDFSKLVLEQLNTIDVVRNSTKLYKSVRIGAAIFERDVNNAFYLHGTDDVNEMKNQLESIKQLIKEISIQCQTMIHEAVKSLYETYFKEDNGDRRIALNNQQVYPNIAIFFTDARTSPRKYAKDGKRLDRYLEKAKAAGITTYVVLLKSNRIKLDDSGVRVTKPPLDQLKMTDGEEKRLYDIRADDNVSDVAGRLATHLNNEWVCKLEDDVRPCVDLTFAFDASCSVDDEDKALYQYVSSETYLAFVNEAQADIQVSAIVFDATARTKILMNEYGNTDADIQAIAQLLQNIDTRSEKCRTMTYKMFDEVIKHHVNKNGDRADVPNVLVMFYDGMTSPLKRRKATIEKARVLKETYKFEIYVVGVKNNNGKDGRVEFEAIASPDRIFPLPSSEVGTFLDFENKDVVVFDLLDKLRSNICGQ